MIAESDPDGVQLSRRAIERLTACRDKMRWVRDGATTVVRDQTGRVRWWTFAGGLAGEWLTGSVGAKSASSLYLSFEATESPDEVCARIVATRPEQLTLGTDVAAKAVEGLKFGELLPADLAAQVIRRRLHAHGEAIVTLAEPVNTAT